MSTTEQTIHIGQTVTGQKHPRQALADRPCMCGCQWVEGQEGTITEILPPTGSGEAAYAACAYVTFSDLESHGPVTIAYYDWELS